MHASKDTIAAVATAPGIGGVGIIRISGEKLLPLAQHLSQKANVHARYAYLSSFYDRNKEIIDQGLMLFFPAPHSFTGEDVIELHIHGGPIVLNRLLREVLHQGARLALPGEFTQRAFLNNKIDLVQAESIADLIEAHSEEAAKMASRSLQGAFSTKITALQEGLTHLRMLSEAHLDFPEEELDSSSEAHYLDLIGKLIEENENLLNNAQNGVRLKEGARVVLLGPPNVGKSSLLNYLSGKESAIVTDIAGTTRDVIHEEIILQGLPLHILDTAGLRKNADTIESIGIERSKKAMQEADIALIMQETGSSSMEPELVALLANAPPSLKAIYVYNKSDLYPKSEKEEGLFISIKEGTGLEKLKESILKAAGFTGAGESLFSARHRHVSRLQKTLDQLKSAQKVIHESELFAEQLRLAQVFLSEITGEFTSNDLLGEIFSHFCIGK